MFAKRCQLSEQTFFDGTLWQPPATIGNQLHPSTLRDS